MPSEVAGIVDARGGLRVVVTDNGFDHHLGKGEQLFVVPGMLVDEPVPWKEIPDVVERVQKHVVRMLAPVSDCGECTACCFTMHVKELGKPSGTWCNNCAPGFGCKIYQQRPSICRSFKCEWLQSQSRNDKMAAHLRPDRCGAIFRDDTTTNDPLIIECHGTPDKHAWAWINEMQRVGFKVREITKYVGEEGKQ